MFSLLLRSANSITRTVLRRMDKSSGSYSNFTHACGRFCSGNSQNSALYKTIQYPIKNDYNIPFDYNFTYPIEEMNNSEISIDTLLLNAETNYVHEFNVIRQPKFDKEDFIAKWRLWSKSLPDSDECWYPENLPFNTYNYHFECLIYFVNDTNYEFHTHDNTIKYYLKSYEELNISTVKDLYSNLDKYVVLMNSIDYFHTINSSRFKIPNRFQNHNELFNEYFIGINKNYIYNYFMFDFSNLTNNYFMTSRPIDVCLITSSYEKVSYDILNHRFQININAEVIHVSSLFNKTYLYSSSALNNRFNNQSYFNNTYQTSSILFDTCFENNVDSNSIVNYSIVDELNLNRYETLSSVFNGSIMGLFYKSFGLNFTSINPHPPATPINTPQFTPLHTPPPTPKHTPEFTPLPTPQPTSESSANSLSSSSKLSGGAIAGIVIGCVSFLGVAGFLIYYFVLRPAQAEEPMDA